MLFTSVGATTWMMSEQTKSGKARVTIFKLLANDVDVIVPINLTDDVIIQRLDQITGFYQFDHGRSDHINELLKSTG